MENIDQRPARSSAGLKLNVAVNQWLGTRWCEGRRWPPRGWRKGIERRSFLWLRLLIGLKGRVGSMLLGLDGESLVGDLGSLRAPQMARLFVLT